MDTTNLKKRGGTWYVRVSVSRPDRAALEGRTELLRSLKTTNLAEARKLRHSAVHELQQEISRRVLAAQLSPGSAEYVIEVARSQRAAVNSGEIGEDMAEAGLAAHVEQYLEQQRRQRGTDKHTGDPLITEAQTRALQLAHKVFAGNEPALLLDQITAHLTEVQPRITKGALESKRKQLTAFSKWAGNVEVATLTRKVGARYMRDTIQTSALAVKTRKSWLGNLHAFGEWLVAYDMVEGNPFHGLSRLLKESTRGGVKQEPRPWTPEEFLGLIGKLPKGSPLLPLACIAGYSGMRIDEIAELRLEDVTDGAFRVAKAKNANSVRFVPMAPALVPIVKTLKASSDDGYLISGLLPGGRDNKRSHFASKYFGRFIRANGFKDETLNFHGLRRAWSQRAETAGIPESTCKLIDGHARQSMSYGLYSPGPDFPVLTAAVKRITYGKACDDLVKSRAGHCKITDKMKRRSRRRVPAVS